MNKLNVIGVDLAKNVIQVSVLSPSNRELRNSALTRRKFAEFLGRQHRSLVAFEACATSHYWARVAQRHGHEVKILPAKAVFPFRQGHKTDENDALAVAEAARRPNVKLAPIKTIEQQGLQAIQRSRELLVHERVSLSNHLRGLLMEFGIVIPQGFASLYRLLPEILEDGENELPDLYRPTLNLLYGRLCDLREDLERLNREIEVLVPFFYMPRWELAKPSPMAASSLLTWGSPRSSSAVVARSIWWGSASEWLTSACVRC
jgi:transposase